MGKPAHGKPWTLPAECIGRLKLTQGTDTSQYLQERKSIETPSVVASERGKAQTILSNRDGVADVGKELQRHRKQNPLESGTAEGDSPVCKSESPPLLPTLQSSTEPVELCAKPGGPPSKAKYYSTTDSGKVARAKDEKHPY